MTDDTAHVDDRLTFGAPARELLQRWNDMAIAGRVQKAIVAMYGHLDDLLCADRFGDCDALIAAADGTRNHVNVVLTLLMATVYAPRERLPNRPTLFRTFLDRLVNEKGQDEATAICGGLE